MQSLFQHNLIFFLLSVALFGLIIGSFLNALAFRLPKILKAAWENKKVKSPFHSLCSRSHCPHCRKTIRAIDNIPILSFFLLKGRCRHCHYPIGWRYPFVEFLTACFSVMTAYHFGPTWLSFCACFLTWGLIVLTLIDIDHQLLPDDLTLPLLWLGLALNISGLFTSLPNAVIGAMSGYLFLWGVYWIFKLLTGKEGMGYGDFKLFAMLGAWLGWMALPGIILMASLAGSLFGITLIVFKQHSRKQPFAFGPFLTLSGWISLLWGREIMRIVL